MDIKRTANEMLRLLSRITPEQWERAKPLISDVIAKRRRERFRVIPGGRSNKRRHHGNQGQRPADRENERFSR